MCHRVMSAGMARGEKEIEDRVGLLVSALLGGGVGVWQEVCGVSARDGCRTVM